MKTQICITVDVEYNIAGTFWQPERFKPLCDEAVHCVVDGRENGLGFILDSLKRGGLSGTFFTEALQTIYFGDEPMGRNVQRIVAAGHDVQLHLHPCWLHFRDAAWRVPGFVPNDSCAGRSDAELDVMMKLGLDTFARWGIAGPVALRTGGFRTDAAVYRAMARAGLSLGSNLSLGVYQPPDAALQQWGGRHLLHGVLELPALSYKAPNLARKGAAAWRTLALTATSKAEMEMLLWSARRANVETIVVLTHPHEFVSVKGFRYDDLKASRINQARLLHLVDFLQRNSGDFEVVTFGGQASQWLQSGPVLDSPLKTSLKLAVLRAAQNALNDIVRF